MFRNLEFQTGVRTTVLFRKGGIWSEAERERLVRALKMGAYYQASMPEYLLLEGHYTDEEINSVCYDGLPYTVETRIGWDNLPCQPPWLTNLSPHIT